MTASGTSFVPVLRTDLLRHNVEFESVVWSPIRVEPVALDPVATVMLDVIDGVASIDELAIDVHETVGVPRETAIAQVQRTISLFDAAGLLSISRAEMIPERAELFVNPPNA